MPITPVTSLDDPRLAPYANMRDAELAQRQSPHERGLHGHLGGLFIAEGELVLERLIGSAYPVESVLLAENRVEGLAATLSGLSPDVPVFVAPQRLFNQIVGFNMHRGVLGLGRRVETRSLGEMLAREGPLLVLEDLVNHDNLGAIFRNAAGLGGPGCGVLLSPRCADPLYRKSLRVSMGHVLTVPFRRLVDWPGELDLLRGAGWTLAALTPDPGAIDLEALAAGAAGGRTALLLGSEGPGLSKAARSRADRAVRIAMPPGPDGRVIDSLNVAMAAGIALYRLAGG